MVDVASLIADLIGAGTPPELVGRVAAAIAARETVVVEQRDEQANRRRAADRERKARARVCGIPQTSADSAEIADTDPLSEEKRKVSPCTPSKEKTQLSPDPLASLVEISSAGAQKRSARKDGDHEAFVEFWSVYPRRENRKPASQAFSKAISAGADPPTVIDGARRYADFVAANGTETQFIAQASTWLNQERWTNAYRIEPSPRRTETQHSGRTAGSGNALLAVVSRELSGSMDRGWDAGRFDGSASSGDPFGDYAAQIGSGMPTVRRPDAR